MTKFSKGRYRRFLFWLSALLTSASLHAGSPVWTYSAPNPASVMIANGGTATVMYTVTNQSVKAKNLLLQSTPGLSASSCYLAGKGSTCNLTLTINGSEVPKEGIHTGPVLCDQGNASQCYQPSAANLLHINRSSAAGHLLLTQNGSPISSLALSPGDSGTLLLSNTGIGSASSLNIQFPFGWQSYFTNNCPALLAPQQSCTLTYTVPTPSAVGILNPLAIQASGVDNSINLPVNIQIVGDINCWGNNTVGQLGDGSSNNLRLTPVQVNTITNAVSIVGGEFFTCALLATGTINCWGKNDVGQLGDGTTADSYTPIAVPGITNAMAITAGYNHACALLNTGTINCWGLNTSGQLGNGSSVNSSNPVPVLNITNAVAITAGFDHTCALLATGAINCWGSNLEGQLGNGTQTSSNSPIPVSNMSNAVAVTGGAAYTCALLKTGAVNCWGLNTSSQLGNNSNINSLTPVSVLYITNAVAITTGTATSCALLNTGVINCWGSNSHGALGINAAGSGSATPMQVVNINNAVTITGGYFNSCSLLDTGEVNCWGHNTSGQLGNNTQADSSFPVTTCSGPGCTSSLTAAGVFSHSFGQHSCAIVP